MKFLDPSNDIAFKKIFGNEQKKSILILQIAKNLLDILDDSIIAEKTGLSITGVQQLRH